MSEWQPIETAPKDGTQVLIYDYYHDYYIAQYTVIDSDGEEGWANENYWLLGDDFRSFNPTHWMPLPAPPKKDKI